MRVICVLLYWMLVVAVGIHGFVLVGVVLMCFCLLLLCVVVAVSRLLLSCVAVLVCVVLCRRYCLLTFVVAVCWCSG